jgi:hypothetical protein
MRLTAAVLILFSVPLRAQGAPPDTTGFRVILEFPVTDTQPRHDAKLSPTLLLRLHRQLHANGTQMGWYAAVYRLPVRDTSRNLLYQSLNWHGPYPTDLLAWLHAEAYFPDDRLLPVYGAPFELRVVCRDCETAGDSTFLHFTAGTILIGARRATPIPAASPH